MVDCLFRLQSTDSMFLGSLQKGSLDVMGAVVELATTGRPGLEWVLRIQVGGGKTLFVRWKAKRDLLSGIFDFELFIFLNTSFYSEQFGASIMSLRVFSLKL